MDHTVDSLKWYLGKEVYLDRGILSEIVYLLSLMINSNMCRIKRKGYELSACITGIYPILKTVDEMTEKDCKHVYGIGHSTEEIT